MPIQIISKEKIEQNIVLAPNKEIFVRHHYTKVLKEAKQENIEEIAIEYSGANNRFDLVETMELLSGIANKLDYDGDIYLVTTGNRKDFKNKELDSMWAKPALSATNSFMAGGMAKSKKHECLPSIHGLVKVEEVNQPIEETKYEQVACQYAEPMFEMPDFAKEPDDLNDVFDIDSSIDDLLEDLEDSFSKTVLNIIDEHNWKDSDVYKRSNISKSVFSTLRSNDDYQPTKNTALALTIGLRLSIEEAEDLLERAGYSFSRSNKTDMIVRLFLLKENYNIMEINAELFARNEKILGAK